ncbi:MULTISPECIES: hypothetical protein [unclassified Streptomyces]|uniref:hypothetical protein n=1 Tax=unclassified Streptomyces TaxID=2593676 RepID=UPI0004BE08FE|nr:MULTISPECIES: hypothetical protein [unclassified Streptomyces]
MARAEAELLARDGLVLRIAGGEPARPRHGKQDVAVIIDAADDLLGVDFLGVVVSTLARR